MKISPTCRKCNSALTQKEIESIKQQIEQMAHSNSNLVGGPWFGSCFNCKDEPFVVS